MSSRRRLLLALATAGAVAASAVLFPDARSFTLGLTAFLLASATGLWLFRAWIRARPQQTALAEGTALGLTGATGFLLLFQNVLVHDALWYYSYLRSALVQMDLQMYGEFVLRNSNGMYLPPPGTPIFHLGISLLQAPLALAVRPLALLLNHLGLVPGGDGYGPLEVGAATFSSMLLALGGVVLIHRLARRLAGGPASTVAQVALLFASPLAFFTFIWPGYPHAATVFLGAIFLLVWSREEPQARRTRPFLLGLLAGALALAHPQDIVYLALPAMDLWWSRPASATHPDSSGGNAAAWRWRLRQTALLGGGALAGFAPQLVAWRATSGHWLPHVYADIGDPFRWSSPALLPVLFSGYNGLITWTPLCGVAIAGLFLLRRSHPRLFRGLLALVLLQWWAIASYGYWWGGASFGARYFLSAYPALGIGLALVVGRMARRTGLVAAGAASAAFVFWNLLLMAQFRLEWIPHNQPPDFGAAVYRQFITAPAVLIDGLLGRFHWNQVLFLDSLGAALESGSLQAVAVCLGVASLLVLLLWGWMGWLLTSGDDNRLPRRAVSVTAAGAAVLSVVMVLAVSPGHGQRLIVRTAASLPERIATSSTRQIDLLSEGIHESPTAVSLPRPPQERADSRLVLDLVSFLHNGQHLRQGETVAWLEPRGAGCDTGELPLRAGVETAETAPGRWEVREQMQHSIDSTSVIQSWWQNGFSSRHYWGHAYHSSWQLPAGCEPDRVVLRTGKGGDLEVRELVLAWSRTDS